jgi:hypothetical protein
MSMQPATAGSDFRVTPSVVGDEVVVTLSGTGDMAAVAPLEQALKQVDEQILAQGLAGARIDISALYLLNSSCIKALISFIHRNMAAKRRYAVRFVVDERLAWQSRTLGVLCRMAPDLVSVVAQAS